MPKEHADIEAAERHLECEPDEVDARERARERTGHHDGAFESSECVVQVTVWQGGREGGREVGWSVTRDETKTML